jgi:hypothetical protein
VSGPPLRFFKNRSERCDVLSFYEKADALAEVTCRDFDSA